MQQPVQDGRGNDSVPKEFAPFAEGAKLVRIGDGRSLRPRLRGSRTTQPRYPRPSPRSHKDHSVNQPHYSLGS